MGRGKHARQTDVFENVEYLQVYRNRKPVLLIENEKINGRTKTEIQKLIGEKLGAGHYRTSIKYFGDPQNASGSIVAIVPGDVVPNKDEFDTEKINKLENKIDKLVETLGKNSGVDLSLLMNMKDQSYQIQIDFYKSRIAMLENENNSLKTRIKELESEQTGNDTNDLVNTLLMGLLSKGNKPGG